MGTSNIILNAQRNKAQPSFQPVKAQRKMRNLIFLISEAHCNVRNKLFDSVETQPNAANAERHFRSKLKRNLTSAILAFYHTMQKQCKKHIFCNLRQKKVNKLLKKADICQYYTILQLKWNKIDRIALLPEKNFESATQLKRNKF